MKNRTLWILGALLLLSCIGFMTIGSRGNWGFVLPFRGGKLLALMVIAVAVSSATILFQTITRNRILTPSIMGFDALFVLLLTGSVFFFGSHYLIQLPNWVPFFVSLSILVLGALALFSTLLKSGSKDLMRMLLTGIILASLFRSLTSFMIRMIDPNEFSFIQVGSFARFNRVDTDLLAVATVLIAITHVVIWRMRHQFDVLGLSHEAAVNLGISTERVQFIGLFFIAVLVSVSTALVGPVTFLGLLVVSITYLVSPHIHHASLLLVAGMISSIVLVAGQTIMERVFKFETPLSTVINLVGGGLFLFLLLRKSKK